MVASNVCKTINIELDMKKTFLAIGIGVCAMTTLMSCDVVEAVASAYAAVEEEELPLVSKIVTLSGEFGSIVNNTVIDVDYAQDANVSAELFCPEEYHKYVVLTIEKGTLMMNLDPSLTEQQKQEVSRKLGKSVLVLTTPTLTDVTVNGSSYFKVNGDLRADKFTAMINGSGDINLGGLQCAKGDFNAVVNGSGDVVVRREVKAKRVDVSVNGSGDVNCDIITAFDVVGQVNGSGDVVINKLVSVNSAFNVNGSGDVKARNIVGDEVIAGVTGSGDVVLTGECEKASLLVIGSGDVSASNLIAQDVVASVTNSGDIVCNAQRTLKAEVGGNGTLKYKGDAKITIQGKKDSVYKL